MIDPRDPKTIVYLIAMTLTAAIVSSASAGDWPAYRHDVRRSAVTDESLQFPLSPAWTYVSPQPPRPAWPDPFRLVNRMDFDYAPQPVIAEGIVCFGSSSDDTVRALDAETGQEKWRFITGGPVRFAPQIEGGRVYFASDDGFVYCLDARSGKPLWTFRAAPADERMIGNHRMISRWPVRTGVLVDDGIVYCVAGMWPAEGIFVYALDADTGKVHWCNDTSGGSTPQGALLLGGDVLLVPRGNSGPMPLDRQTGKPIAWASTAFRAGAGGTWLTISGEKIYSFSMHRAQTLMVQPYSLTTGEPAGRAWGAGAVPQLSIDAQLRTFQTHSQAKVSAMVAGDKLYARPAYAVALAGGALLMGHDGAVTAEKTGVAAEIWRAGVSGEAREIAVADGRLFVSTSEGVITCFAPANSVKDPTTIHDPASALRQTKPPVPTDSQSALLKQIRDARMDRGYALVVGDREGRLSEIVAAHTGLAVIHVEPDRIRAAKLRERLLSDTVLYGSKIHVPQVERLDALPLAQYFANAVIVASAPEGLSGKELYRLLHPCGGILLFSGLKTEDAQAIIEQSGALETEIQQSGDERIVVRGKLPGALDWDSSVKTEERVKWPLRPLWFGGPSTRQVQNFREGARGPVVANGRYFIYSEHGLTAVDAYNGAVLWTRPVPKPWPPNTRDVDGLLYIVADPAPYERADFQRALQVNDESVFVVLGKAYFQGQGVGSIQLNAHTGEQQKVFGPFNSPTMVSLKSPQKWPVALDATQSGEVAMESTSGGLVLTLATKDPSVTPLDFWELMFDFRPVDARYGLYEHGAFHIRVVPAKDKNTPASWTPLTGPAHPTFVVSGAPEATGTKTTVTLSWSEIEKLVGARPSSFDFAAALNGHSGGRTEPIVRRHLFGNWSADKINNGWARIALNDSAATTDGASPGSIVASGNDVRPSATWGPAGHSQKSDPSLQETPTVHPLTGEPVPKVFGIAPVCGAAYCSANVISQSGAVYDLADDSGRRPLYGTKTGCTTPQIAALGMFLISEEWGHCICNYPFRTSLALAPAERRLNEDWAQYYDRDVDTEVRQAHVNLGAPGDRRDASGNLWLGSPRASDPRTPDQYLNPDHPLPYPLGMRDAQTGLWYRRPVRSALWLPLEVECVEGLGPYRFSADRVQIHGTDRPWIYGSGYRGISKATLKMNFFKPLVSTATSAAMVVDGKLHEASWGDSQSTSDAPPTLPYTGTRVLFRHDRQALYVGITRPPMIRWTRAPRVGALAAFKGEPSPWLMGNSKPNELSPKDNWWRLIFSSDEGRRAAHFTVTPDGTRAEALHDAAQDPPAWNPEWQCAVDTNEQGWTLEMAIPWQTLAAAGVQADRVAVNFLMMDPGLGTEALTYLGLGGYNRCSNFTPLGLGKPSPIPPRLFTVRLHFAEPDDVAAGERVFDVKLQEKTVLADFDVVREAGGPRTATVKEFLHVEAADALTIEFVSKSKTPILSGMEVVDEGIRR